jgi:hypothetical protein
VFTDDVGEPLHPDYVSRRLLRARVSSRTPVIKIPRGMAHSGDAANRRYMTGVLAAVRHERGVEVDDIADALAERIGRQGYLLSATGRCATPSTRPNRNSPNERRPATPAPTTGATTSMSSAPRPHAA